jgi:hypothetical protein
MPTPQSKRYSFVINNDQPIVATILDRFQREYCMYLIYRRDPESLQGFFTLKRKLSATGVRRALERRTPTLDEWMKELHLGVLKETSEEAAEHCKKDGNYIEFGETPYPGKRGGRIWIVNNRAPSFRKFRNIHELNTA